MSNLANKSILLMIISSQISSFSSTRVFNKSIPVSKSSIRSLSKYFCICSTVLVQSNPILVKLLKISIIFLLISRSILPSNIYCKRSAMPHYWIGWRLRQSMAKLRRVSIIVRSVQVQVRFFGGQIHFMKPQIDSITFGYCIKRNGASVFTLYSIKVLMEKFSYYFSRD